MPTKGEKKIALFVAAMALFGGWILVVGGLFISGMPVRPFLGISVGAIGVLLLTGGAALVIYEICTYGRAPDD